MAKLHDPVVLITVSRALMMLTSVASGLYIWEFFTHLYYEWSVIKGHRSYLWTPVNCEVWTILKFGFGYIAFSFSSLLIILRIIAIWKKEKIIVAFAAAVWLTSASLVIHDTTQIRTEWVPQDLTCGPPNTQSNKLAIIAILVADTTLLLIMLLGLLRLRHRGEGWFNLGRLLWKQGVIYLLVATIAEITPVVFVSLDLDAAFDLMFLMPSLITMSIAATRMYRSLTDFVLYTDISGNGSDCAPKIDFRVSDARWSNTRPKNRIEVTIMNTAHECCQSQTGHYVSDGQLSDKLGGPDLKDDVEREK